MKKRVFAVLLAFCMIAGMCVLFASAEEVSYKKDSVVEYVVSPAYGKELDHDATFQNLKSSKQIAATVRMKTSPGSLPASLLSNKSSFSYDDLKMICDVDTKGAYFNSAYNVYASYTDLRTDGAKKTATVKVTVSVRNDVSYQKVYRVLVDTIKGDSNEKVLYTYDKERDFEELPKYQINGGLTDTITIYDVSFIEEAPPVLDKTSVSLIYKESEVLKSSEPVVWSSSNDKVAKIDKVDDKTGVLTITGEGVATITATTQDGRTATCVVMAKYAWWQVLIRIFLLGFLWY